MSASTPTPGITDSPSPLNVNHKDETDFDELGPAAEGDEDQVAATSSLSSNILRSGRKFFSASIPVSAITETNKKEEAKEIATSFKQAIAHFAHQGLAFFKNLGLGWSLVLLDLFIGIPLSLLLTYINKQIISYIGYEKIMRCPSGIIGSSIFFIVINTLLVINWGFQLNEEARVEMEIVHWGKVVEFLEGEKERMEERLMEEVEAQLRVEEFDSPRRRLEDKNGEWVREEDQIPSIPSTIARRVIRPAIATASSSTVPAISSKLKPSDADTSKEMRKAVIDPDTLMELKKTAPAKMTVGRKAGARMREQTGRFEGEESD